MTDDEFLRRLRSAELDAFTHRDHIRLAWLTLGAHTWDDALPHVRSTIRGYATRKGAADKYHETRTIAWLALVGRAMERTGAVDFDALLDGEPSLLDRDLLAIHFSADRLASDAARTAWVEPDRAPLPIPATRHGVPS